MTTPLQSIIHAGTKLWLDSIDPKLVQESFEAGLTGATSNPIIVSDLIRTGRFDDAMTRAIEAGQDDNTIAWTVTDQLVRNAQSVFEPVWEKTGGNDGYVSFELDPLLEDLQLAPPHDQRVARYVELGKQWSRGHTNRMIKVPATPAGIAALEDLVAAGVTVNVTLIFSERQYLAARDAVWRGAQKRDSLASFKSVYSIFVSRVDVYTQKHCVSLDAAAQGMVGIVNAKRIWKMNQAFWQTKHLNLEQEIIFASTGTKNPDDPADKYVSAFVGSDIQTNPPAINDKIQKMGKTYVPSLDQLPEAAVLNQIDQNVDQAHMEKTLMEEGLKKFADPQKGLLQLIGEKRAALATS